MKKILHGEKAVAIASASMNKSVFDTDVGVSDSELLNNVVSTVNEVFENDKKISGSVLLTDSRIILYSKRTLGGYYFKDFRINSINGVTFKNGFLKSSMIFHTNNGDTKINMPDKNAAKKLNIALETRISKWKKEAIAIESYDAVEITSHKPTKHSDNINSDLLISRETEFYQGFIRLKMSVTNTSSFVVNDVTLDFDYDNNLLRIDRHEPDYQIENGKVIFGNISVDSSKTVAIYFDPMMCSKGTDINCQINYKDAKGQLQTTQMESKKISVVCPIMETESDINIGRLKEFIKKLPYSDSKVYQLQNNYDIDILKNISREVVQKHNVKHIRTLITKDEKMCEVWYYGKTKVHSHDIVIKITILSETQNIELFAATQTVESLAGLLAEVGRELKSAIESKITGNVQQVINVSIKDSIVQRSNLLSYCDIDGNCSGDVVIEDSLVMRSNISSDAEVKDSVVQKTNVGNIFCTACGEAVPAGAKFCMECGERLK
ncbi:MAG: PH domain-containing protein [Methanosarcinaceae archaeon]|nr:PH domain-containing protein [Methanosarcinaceae archaeon]